MSSWSQLLDHAEPQEHFVQLYGADDRLLARNVSRYLAEGLRGGDSLLVIATPAHTASILGYLHESCSDTAPAIREGRLVTLDARETLERFMTAGEPSRERFLEVVGGSLEQVRCRSRSGKVRAFGEMVGLLWTDGLRHAAVRLEEEWAELLQGGTSCLFCAYPIDIFEPDGDMDGLRAVLRAHTHLCAGSGTMLSRATA